VRESRSPRHSISTDARVPLSFGALLQCSNEAFGRATTSGSRCGERPSHWRKCRRFRNVGASQLPCSAASRTLRQPSQGPKSWRGALVALAALSSGQLWPQRRQVAANTRYIYPTWGLSVRSTPRSPSSSRHRRPVPNVEASLSVILAREATKSPIMKAVAILSLVSVALAGALEKRACQANNCIRAVTGTRLGPEAISSHQADCSSFVRTTVTPSAV
jgi:hypothetical protein